MTPLRHAKTSARRYGGVPEDYMALHTWMDQTKTHVADLRHRLILHNSFGVSMAEQVHGTTFRRASDNVLVAVRVIVEDHIKEDLGFIPSLEQCLAHTPITNLVSPSLRKLLVEVKAGNLKAPRRDMMNEEKYPEDDDVLEEGVVTETLKKLYPKKPPHDALRAFMISAFIELEIDEYVAEELFADLNDIIAEEIGT